MTRKQLLTKICPNVCKDICVLVGCEHCNVILNELLDEYDNHVIEQYMADTNLKEHDKQIRVKVIDEYKNVLLKLIKDEQDTRYGYLDGRDIIEIAEQLKIGVKYEV